MPEPDSSITTVGDWLASRTQPPDRIACTIRDALAGDVHAPIGRGDVVLLNAAERVLARVVSVQDTAAVRSPTHDLAVELLTADALITYALELCADVGGDVDAFARTAAGSIARLGADE